MLMSDVVALLHENLNVSTIYYMHITHFARVAILLNVHREYDY